MLKCFLRQVTYYITTFYVLFFVLNTTHTNNYTNNHFNTNLLYKKNNCIEVVKGYSEIFLVSSEIIEFGMGMPLATNVCLLLMLVRLEIQRKIH